VDFDPEDVPSQTNLGGDVSAIDPEWCVDWYIPLFQENPDGTLRSITDVDVRVGQFVDVLVYPEIVNEARGKVTVRFVMDRIIVMNAHPTHKVTAPHTYMCA
jgi:hypothetical protein